MFCFLLFASQLVYRFEPTSTEIQIQLPTNSVVHTYTVNKNHLTLLAGATPPEGYDVEKPERFFYDDITPLVGETAIKRYEVVKPERVFYDSIQKLYLKFIDKNPDEHPENEFIVNSLYKAFGRPQDAVATVLIDGFKRGEKAYWILVSQAVGNGALDLAETVKKSPDFFKRKAIDSKNYSLHFVMTFLLHLADAKAANYIVKKTNENYVLVSIDHEMSLDPKYCPIPINVLFYYDEYERSINENIRQKLLDFKGKIREWGENLNASLPADFFSARINAKVNQIQERFKKMLNALKRRDVTHKSLFQEFYPHIEMYYSQQREYMQKTGRNPCEMTEETIFEGMNQWLCMLICKNAKEEEGEKRLYDYAKKKDRRKSIAKWIGEKRCKAVMLRPVLAELLKASLVFYSTGSKEIAESISIDRRRFSELIGNQKTTKELDKDSVAAWSWLSIRSENDLDKIIRRSLQDSFESELNETVKIKFTEYAKGEGATQYAITRFFNIKNDPKAHKGEKLLKVQALFEQFKTACDLPTATKAQYVVVSVDSIHKKMADMYHMTTNMTRQQVAEHFGYKYSSTVSKAYSKYY